MSPCFHVYKLAISDYFLFYIFKFNAEYYFINNNGKYIYNEYLDKKYIYMRHFAYGRDVTNVNSHEHVWKPFKSREMNCCWKEQIEVPVLEITHLHKETHSSR